MTARSPRMNCPGPSLVPGVDVAVQVDDLVKPDAVDAVAGAVQVDDPEKPDAVDAVARVDDLVKPGDPEKPDAVAGVAGVARGDDLEKPGAVAQGDAAVTVVGPALVDERRQSRASWHAGTRTRTERSKRTNCLRDSGESSIGVMRTRTVSWTREKSQNCSRASTGAAGPRARSGIAGGLEPKVTRSVDAPRPSRTRIASVPSAMVIGKKAARKRETPEDVTAESKSGPGCSRRAGP